MISVEATPRKVGSIVYNIYYKQEYYYINCTALAATYVRCVIEIEIIYVSHKIACIYSSMIHFGVMYVNCVLI